MTWDFKRPKLAKTINIAEKYDPAMEIINQVDADIYFDQLVRHSMENLELSYEDAVKLERDNLGYWAGYFGRDVSIRVENLFQAKHPILGSFKSEQIFINNIYPHNTEEDLFEQLKTSLQNYNNHILEKKK